MQRQYFTSITALNIFFFHKANIARWRYEPCNNLTIPSMLLSLTAAFNGKPENLYLIRQHVLFSRETFGQIKFVRQDIKIGISY